MQAAFEEDPPRDFNALLNVPEEGHEADALLLNLDGYEGPIHVLLDLARNQKVDLREISILQLARQYLQFNRTGIESRNIQSPSWYELRFIFQRQQ